MAEPPGYGARPLEPGDADAVAALIGEFDRAYVEQTDQLGGADVAGWWRGFDLSSDSLALIDGATIAACGTVRTRMQDTLDLDAYVRPAHQGRGLGGALLEWAEGETRRRGLRTLQGSALTADEAAEVLFIARGFARVRRFYRMLIDLDGPPPEPVWPEGFEVSSFRSGDERTVHAVTEEAFAEHWGHEPREFDRWRVNTFEQEWWDPTLVHLVRRDDEVVAVEVNAIRFGMGWVNTIGTLKPWRGLGLGRALLLTAFGELYRRGERRIGLGVDAGNETGATYLYESVGMRVAWQADVYEKRLQVRL